MREDYLMSKIEYIKKISQKIDMLCGIFSKYNFGQDAKDLFVESLMQFQNNKHIFAALDELGRGRKFPYIEDIIEKVNEITKRNPPIIEKRLDAPSTDPDVIVTEEYRKKALLSIMWMHYSFNNSNPYGTIIQSEFKRIFPDEEFNFNKLIEKFPKDKVIKWMERQPQ